MTAASEKQISYINALRVSRNIGEHDERITKRIALCFAYSNGCNDASKRAAARNAG